jgi:two-component system LytT family sensor kinase
MRKTTITLLHLSYWLMYLVLLAIVFSIVTLQIKRTLNIYLVFPIIILYLTPNLVSFYSSYFYLFPKFLAAHKYFRLIACGLFFCLISAFSGSLISTIFFGFEQPIFNDRNEFIGFTVSLALIAAVHAVMALVIRGFVSWFDEMKLREELTQKNYETEIALIKSQINPHFLFNTINNIDVLISKDPNRASEYLNKLADILRYMVYQTKSERIPLTTELDYLGKYLELQKIRTTNPNYVNFEVGGEPNNLQIAPMIFFPFIENAFKHTENDKKLNSIKIRILIGKDSVNFECQNTFQKRSDQNQDFGGVGNDLIRKRLALVYPEKHKLQVSDYDGVYQVKLSIQI